MCARELNEFDLAVIGAGAAGQLGAISAAESGKRVVLLEQLPRMGVKLLATGGGRANITNMSPQDEIVAAFGRQGRFIGPAMEILPPAGLCELLARFGVNTVQDDQMRVYPSTERAADVQSALRRQIQRLGVDVRLGLRTDGLWIEDGKLVGVETSRGRIKSPQVLLSCGGKSYPNLGGTGGGYALARQGGHSIAEPIPALVPLLTEQSWVANLAGMVLPGARVCIALPKQSKAGITGDILFTHRGLSGPAVLNFSGTVSQLLQRYNSVPLRIEVVSGLDAPCWDREIESWRGRSGKRLVLGLLREKIPASLAAELCRLAGVDQQVTASQLSGAARGKLSALLGSLELTVTGTEGFGVAFVTRGGVKLKEVDPKTLQSKILPGLYLAGEILDLDGPTGGFNLQWAFASGWLAGQQRWK